MGNVLTFTPRPRPPEPANPAPLSDLDLRAQIEEAAQVAVDTAERLIAVLDRIDGDADLEDSADAEPSLAAPENHHGSQVTWLRGNDQDREAEAPKNALPAIPASPVPKLRPVARVAAPLAQGRQSSIVAAAAVALIDFAGVR